MGYKSVNITWCAIKAFPNSTSNGYTKHWINNLVNIPIKQGSKTDICNNWNNITCLVFCGIFLYSLKMSKKEKINKYDNNFEFYDTITGKKLINVLNKEKLTAEELDEIFLEDV